MALLLALPAQACITTLPGERVAADLRIDGPLTFRLGDDRRIRLSGIDAPTPEAREALTRVAHDLARTLKADVILSPETDRHNRHSAVPAVGDDDLRETLLDAGSAFRSGAIEPACADMLKAAEGRAIAARAGLWQAEDWPLAATDAARLRKARHHVAIVEGRVLSVRTLRFITYVNFGKAGSGALTATIAERDRAAFRAHGVEVEALSGQNVRLRGLITVGRGPRLRLDTPDQIDLLP